MVADRGSKNVMVGIGWYNILRIAGKELIAIQLLLKSKKTVWVK
jgi:hypothetical protein